MTKILTEIWRLVPAPFQAKKLFLCVRNDEETIGFLILSGGLEREHRSLTYFMLKETSSMLVVQVHAFFYYAMFSRCRYADYRQLLVKRMVELAPKASRVTII